MTDNMQAAIALVAALALDVYPEWRLDRFGRIRPTVTAKVCWCAAGGALGLLEGNTTAIMLAADRSTVNRVGLNHDPGVRAALLAAFGLEEAA